MKLGYENYSITNTLKKSYLILKMYKKMSFHLDWNFQPHPFQEKIEVHVKTKICLSQSAHFGIGCEGKQLIKYLGASEWGQKEGWLVLKLWEQVPHIGRPNPMFRMSFNAL